MTAPLDRAVTEPSAEERATASLIVAEWCRGAFSSHGLPSFKQTDLLETGIAAALHAHAIQALDALGRAEAGIRQIASDCEDVARQSLDHAEGRTWTAVAKMLRALVAHDSEVGR